jgi:hypothetical protein
MRLRLSVLDGAREGDSDMRRTGWNERNNSHKMCLARRVAEPAGPLGDRESATYRDDLCGCRPTILRLGTIDLHEKLIAIGGGKHFGPLSTAVRLNNHHALLSESAQMGRLTRTGRGTIMRIVASERTPIGPVCGKRESYNRGERHHQACRSPAVSLEHDFTPRQRVSVDAALLSMWNGFPITLPRALRGMWVSSSVEAAGTAMVQHHSLYPDRIRQEYQPHGP